MSGHRFGLGSLLVIAVCLSPAVLPAQEIPAQQAPTQQVPVQTPAPVPPVAGEPAPASAPDALAPASGDKTDSVADVPPAATAQSPAQPGDKARAKHPIKLKKEKKEKPPKLVPVNIVKGELTVDGLIAKADLNFQVLDLHYFYIWVPGTGTVVMSNKAFAGSKLEENALDGSTITVKVDGHQMQLTCDHKLLAEKKPKPLSLFVALDTSYQKDSIYPEFGYGDKKDPPYAWPGSLVDQTPNAKAPPLPPNLRQKTESVKMCPKNADGTPSDANCRVVDVPMTLGKKS